MRSIYTLILSLCVLYVTILFITVIPSTVSVLDYNSQQVSILGKFHRELCDKSDGKITILGLEFDNKLHVFETLLKVIGIFISISIFFWSIHTWTVRNR